MNTPKKQQESRNLSTTLEKMGSMSERGFASRETATIGMYRMWEGYETIKLTSILKKALQCICKNIESSRDVVQKE